MLEHIAKENGVGPLAVVRAHEVETRSNGGWELVAVTNEDEVNSFSYDVPDPHPNAYQGQKMMCTGSRVERITLFVMRQDKESFVKHAHERIAAANKLEAEARDAAKKAQEEAKGFETEAKKQKIVTERLEGEIKGLREDRDNLRTTASKMEADLAKLRLAIGSERFGAILAVTEKK